MPKYRQKPVVIEAFQMTKERRWDNSEWPEWLHMAWQEVLSNKSVICIDPTAPIAEGHKSAAELWFGSIHSGRRLKWGDWIIRQPNGNLCICDPSIFEKTYELVEETPLDTETRAP